MIFDWKNKEEAIKNGIFEDVVKCLDYKRNYMKSPDGVVSNHTFKNFEQLEFEEGALIENCVFENCGSITFYECRINNCTFRNVETIYSYHGRITNTTFCDIRCNSDMFLAIEECIISHCNFENAELRKDALLIDSMGDSTVKECEFKTIRTDRHDGEIIKAHDIVGKIFQKQVSADIVEEKSCTGLDKVMDIDGNLLSNTEE